MAYTILQGCLMGFAGWKIAECLWWIFCCLCMGKWYWLPPVSEPPLPSIESPWFFCGQPHMLCMYGFPGHGWNPEQCPHGLDCPCHEISTEAERLVSDDAP